MLDREKAQCYYDSLLFNHVKSGGTCEQRVLVLRARFDRILEEIAECNDDSKSFYVEKLQQIFKATHGKFSKKDQDECHALRKYLNGVQHSTFEADEQQYILSLKRISRLLYLISDVGIPSELSSIWLEKLNNGNKKETAFPVSNENVSRSIILPVTLCIDIQDVSDNFSKKEKLNRAINRFIKEISDHGIPVDLTLYLIDKMKIKVIEPFTNTISFMDVDTNLHNTVNHLFSMINDKINSIINSCDRRRTMAPWLVTLLNEETLNNLQPNNNLLSLSSSKQLIVIPVGLTSGMQLVNYKGICNEREALILQEDNEENFFNWLFNSIKIKSSQNL